MKVTYLPPPSDAESDEYRARRRDTRPAAEWRTRWGSSDGDDKEDEMATKATVAGGSRRALAEAIAARLFDMGGGELYADRLVLMRGDQDLGGWREGPVVDVIERLLPGDQSNEGAQADRDATKAFVRRRLRKALQLQLAGPSGVEQLQAVLAYLDGRPARYAAAPGGLSGRKRK